MFTNVAEEPAAFIFRKEGHSSTLKCESSILQFEAEGASETMVNM
jgi:hypothetical protein